MRLPDVFYPVAGTAREVALAAASGARFIQLRFKGPAIERPQQVRESLDCCRATGAVCVVNDHWHVALEAGAEWVHLGQEDLDGLPKGALEAMKTAGVKLGISTHDRTELRRALALGGEVQLGYVALGPVFATTLKVMRWHPQGLSRLGRWRRRLGNVPLVAIGGLTPGRAVACLEAGADSCAAVSALFRQPDPAAALAAWRRSLSMQAHSP
ncbi:thiamine phosphate synthase [Formicincola oecophyllae]|uniref:Thiamine phosphate synthase n=1 Tax=Formicincola oecophyllae TaxID=2558361 RepID=A0A4Y6UB46_9PROT|nr:thiamine phosphate synthase [Formicincola oecophyllae]QDH13687.1 thiamine phosphate synthase [Formicincola oecophyllae]